MSTAAQLPLAGKRVLVTRAQEQAGALARLLADAGADVVEIAAIEIAPPDDPAPLDAAIRRLNEYAWVAFTSANGVRGFFARPGAAALARAHVAAVGEATARELELRGVRAQLLPSDASQTGAGLGRALVEAGARAGARVLVARAQPRAAAGAPVQAEGAPVQEDRPELVRVLQAAGAQVDEVGTHRTVTAAGAVDRVRAEVARGLDAAVFMSPSAVRSAGAPLRGSGVLIACVGPITAESAEEMGLHPAVVPSAHTAEALVEALCAHFARSSP